MVSKEVRSSLLEIRKMRKEQLLFFQELAKPVRDNIKWLDMVLRCELPLEHYMKRNKKTEEYIKKLFIVRR